VKRSIVVLSILCLFAVQAHAAFEFKVRGARAMAVCGAYSTRAQGADSVFWNPAGLGVARRAEITSFCSQLYSLSNLSDVGTAASIPFRFGTAGIAFSRFGTFDYQEQEVVLSQGFRFGHKFFAGVNARAFLLRIDGFGSDTAFGLDAGAAVPFAEKFRLAFTARNLNRPSIGVEKEPLPSGWTLGVCYAPARSLSISADILKIGKGQASFRSGTEISFGEVLSLGFGVSNEPMEFAGGLGIEVKGMRVDYAYLHHNVLSGTHQFSASWKFGAVR
jgi:hypothetical protein